MEPTENTPEKKKTSQFTRPIKAFIRSRVVAGDTNSQIRDQLLRRFGITNCSNARLVRYRDCKQVNEAIASMDLEWQQAGLANRARRLQALDWYGQQLLDRMQGRIPGEARMSNMPVRLDQLVDAGKELREVIKLITLLREGTNGQAGLGLPMSPITAVTGADGQVNPGNIMGMLTDALEIWLNNEAAGAPAPVEVEVHDDVPTEIVALLPPGDDDE